MDTFRGRPPSKAGQSSEKTRLVHFRCRESRGTGCLSLSGLSVSPPALRQALTPHLSHVYLSGCRLSGRVPPVFSALPRLTLLDLSDNGLDRLPPDTFTHNPRLSVLDLSSNRLTALPPSLGEVRALTELTAAHNDLVDLPSELGQLGALRLLDVSHNLLRSLPGALCSGPARLSLRVVRAGGNVLRELPEQLGGLMRLEELDVSDNALRDVPPSARGLTRLTALHHAGNQWTSPRVCTSPDVKVRQLGASYGPRALETLYTLMGGTHLEDTLK